MTLKGLDERLTAPDVLPAYIANTLGLSTDAVYAGKTTKNPRSRVDVAIVWNGPERLARGGGDQVWVHQHILVMSADVNAGPKGAGTAANKAMSTRAALLIAALDGQRPFFESMPDVKHHRCEPTGTNDNTEGGAGRLEVRMTLWTFTQGTGTQDIADTFGGGP